MRYIVAGSSDKGILKNTNQDALSVKIANTNYGKVVFAILCDGMGGFEQGELASSTTVHAFSKWFEECFLKNIEYMDDFRIKKELGDLAVDVNTVIYDYGISNTMRIGTTLLVVLIIKDKYYCMNIGDCRLYKLNRDIVQLTTDHSWVAQQVELGIMSKEEARTSKRKNQLTRCLGAELNVVGDFYEGNVEENDIFILCCDGVRNKVYDNELFYYFHPTCMLEDKAMYNNINYIFELNKSRHEKDNMSIILIRAIESTMIIYNKKIESLIEKDITIIESDEYLNV